MSEYTGLICDGCGQYIEFEVPVTFCSQPLCEECENKVPAPSLDADHG